MPNSMDPPLFFEQMLAFAFLIFDSSAVRRGAMPNVIKLSGNNIIRGNSTIHYYIGCE